MRKISLIVGAAVGYILGARAGRERYDQIAEKANKVWTDPRVQEKVEDVKTTAPELVGKASDGAKQAADKAKAKVSGKETTDLGGSYDNPTGSLDSDGNASIDATGFGPGGDRLP